ncbi:hypothetical protein Tco_1313149 [Tanacetum coccineum]
MVMVPIHQDTSSVPPMTTLAIDLTVSYLISITIHAPLPTSTATLKQHMADLIQSNLALEERLEKHGSRLYNLENLNIPHKASQAVDEIVTDAVDWAMQALLRARFSDLPAKPLERDYSNQLLADLEEAHRKKRKKCATPRSPSGSPPLQPPPPPPLAGTSGAPGSKDPSSSKSATSAPQSMAWTTFDTRYESIGISGAQELSPTDSLIHDDSIPDEQVHLSDDEDFGNDHLLKADSRKDWWKPLPVEEIPATPEPAWTIPSSNLQVNKIELTQADFEGQTYEVTNPEGDQVRIDVNRPLPLGGPPGHDTIQTQFFFNKELKYLRYGSKGSSPALSISKMKDARYPDFGLELKFYIDRYDSPSHRKEVRTHMQILSVVRLKAYSRYGYDYLSEIVLRRADFQEHTIAEKDFKNLYPSDFEDLNLLLLQGHLDHLPGSDKRMLSTAVKLWTRNLLNLTQPGWDAKGYKFKHDYTIIESPRAVMFQVGNNDRKIMRFNKIYKFSDGTLTRILEALDYRFKEFKVKRLNPEHPSDTKVLTMKMEILLEPTSNKLLWVFNSLVHSLRALSTLRRSGLRTASAAAKPCQGDSSEFYLITGTRMMLIQEQDVEELIEFQALQLSDSKIFKLEGIVHLKGFSIICSVDSENCRFCVGVNLDISNWFRSESA